MISKNSDCFNCSSVPKYKCPKCRIPYCSVNCYKEHQKVECSKPDQENITKISNVDEISNSVINLFPTEDTLSHEALLKLKDSTGLRECLQNPHVQHILSSIDKSTNPTDLIAQAMLEPIFVEFVDECLAVVNSSEEI